MVQKVEVTKGDAELSRNGGEGWTTIFAMYMTEKGLMYIFIKRSYKVIRKGFLAQYKNCSFSPFLGTLIIGIPSRLTHNLLLLLSALQTASIPSGLFFLLLDIHNLPSFQKLGVLLDCSPIPPTNASTSLFSLNVQ